LQELLASPDKHYLIDGRELYVCSLRPLYFGSDETGTLLGYVVSGVSIERTVRQISQPTGVEATFLSNGEVVASTLSPSGQTSLAKQFRLLSGAYRMPLTMTFGNTRFLAATEDLSANATSPLQLLVLKSFEPAERSITRIDRMVLSAGLLALMSGTILMIALSRLVTRPLEELSRSVVAFGVGDGMQRVPGYGTQEVRQLSTAFVSMRKEIQQANQARLESERLATIGRMASSVSHDLRHYLAAIYANAEFLAADRLSVQERSEIFADIRTAVHGTTEMIESLLIFSRTGSSFRRSPESMATLVERAVALVRAHPDAEGISIVTRYEEPTETAAVVDGKQIERAICNLLLNACQALRPIKYAANVTVTVESQDRYIIVNVIDSGQGVPESIRNSLFDPFVSEGKQKGTGLGLTLAHCIAVEHGGEVVLISSRPGETIFSMTIARDLQSQGPLASSETSRHDKAIDHEKLRF
jgi:signal transduction histidine kinase